jgi:hypothetical protein
VTGTTKVASRSRRTSWDDEDLPFLPRCRVPARASRNRNYLEMYWWKHSSYGLLEVDVTRARQLIEEHKAPVTASSTSVTEGFSLLAVHYRLPGAGHEVSRTVIAVPGI